MVIFVVATILQSALQQTWDAKAIIVLVCTVFVLIFDLIQLAIQFKKKTILMYFIKKKGNKLKEKYSIK